MNAADPSYPLTDQDCDCINTALEKIALAKDVLAKCKNCGLNVDAAIARANEQENMAKAIKAQFFPTRP